MNEKSWASLAPLLDHRRYVESIVAGITIPAHPDFRVCVTMNEDESTYEVPDYILSRLQPTLTLGFPTRDDEMAILKYHLPFAEDALLALTVEFLQQAHQAEARLLAARRDQPAAVRDQADGPGPRASDRPRRRLARGPVLRARRRGGRPRGPRPPQAPGDGRPARADWAWATCSSAPMIRFTPMRPTTCSKRTTKTMIERKTRTNLLARASFAHTMTGRTVGTEPSQAFDRARETFRQPGARNTLGTVQMRRREPLHGGNIPPG